MRWARPAPRTPRLIDFTWGRTRAPKVTLVGKGVCFDTGGLDIKPASGMLLMKKDMGGAANVLGLAQMIMAARLKVRLRVLIPAVENSIAGNAFRPGDVLTSRKGIRVEIGNTDAEGRLVLADALALADEESPDLLVDMATLTGAARVALGPDLPPFYTSDDELAADLARHAAAANDPLWRMPFWTPYYALIESGVAEIRTMRRIGFCRLGHRGACSSSASSNAPDPMSISTSSPGRRCREARPPQGGEAQAHPRPLWSDRRALRQIACSPDAGIGQNETAPKRSRAVAVGCELMSVTLSAAQALQLWHDVNLHLVHGDEPDLSIAPDHAPADRLSGSAARIRCATLPRSSASPSR